MKNVKKVLALMLALVMCMGMFAGCVTDDGEGDYTGSVPTVSIPAVDDSVSGKTNAERYPLESTKTFTIATRHTDPNERDLFQLWGDVTGVEVNWAEMSGDSLSAAMAGGSMPDAICISWGVSKEIAYEYGKAGKLVNFADYLGYMPNLQKLLEKHPEVLTNFLNLDGSFYSLPTMSGGLGSPANILYVREDMVREAGATIPTTIDEFKQFILDIQEHYSNVEGFKALNFLLGGEWGYIEWNGYMDNYFFPAFGTEATQTGYDLVDGKIVLGCATEQYKRYLEFISWVYASGACEQNIFETDSSNINKAKVAANQNAIFPAAGGITTGNFESGKVELTLLEPLTSQWQDKQIWTNNAIGDWELNCINGRLPEEDIITLVQWFDAFYATDEDPLNEEGTVYGNFLYKGEKGVHYQTHEDGTYERLYKGDYDTTTAWAANEAASSGLYLSWDQSIQKEETYFYCKQVGVRDNLWPYMIDRWSYSSLFLTVDETFDSTDVNTDLNVYMESAFAKFITGEWTVANNWDEYMNGLDSIGALDLVETYQAAYDRYN